MPLVSIGNVNHTISDLKKRGFWIYGLDGEATQSVTDEDFAKPSVFILGNEGSGIRQKTLEHCDIPLRIPISQKTESLNASVAAAVVCYEWSKKHPGALTDIEKRV
jgi:23S rRNA (guanosine2251-2'-O)-methyltransferase